MFEELDAFIKKTSLVGTILVLLFHSRQSNYYSLLAETFAISYNLFAGHWLGGSAAEMIKLRTISWPTPIAGMTPTGAISMF